jgi:protein-S-isoprenylcysteine O-methyltransferase Ste14
MPHFDGPLYEASVLVYGTAVIEFTKYKEETQRVLLEERSLHRFMGEAYKEWMHGVSVL